MKRQLQKAGAIRPRSLAADRAHVTLAAGLIAIVTCVLAADCAAQLIISEFRLSGPNGEGDEFIEIYNNSGADHTVTASTGTGYAVAGSDGAARFIILNGTVIPNRGHYLGCRSGTGGYTLTNYPAGNGTTATCDATYMTGIPLNSGIAIFNTSLPGNFTLANRMDAVGSTGTANTIYKEGTGVRSLFANTTNYSYLRRLGGGCIGTDPGVVDSNCASESAIEDTAEPTTPVDTNNNLNDFVFVNTVGSNVAAPAQGQQRRLGAPGPENLSSPIMRQSSFAIGLIDPGVCENCPPNRERDFNNDSEVTTPDAFGSIFIRRKITNQTGGNVTRLRVRVVDITTAPAGVFSLPAAPNNTCGNDGALCAADLRPLTSTAVTVPLSGGGNATVQGPIEQASAPANQTNGGGYNSSLSAGTVTLATPLANGAAINLQFRLGVEQQGKFRFTFIIEALPSTACVGLPCLCRARLALRSDAAPRATSDDRRHACNGKPPADSRPEWHRERH